MRVNNRATRSTLIALFVLGTLIAALPGSAAATTTATSWVNAPISCAGVSIAVRVNSVTGPLTRADGYRVSTSGSAGTIETVEMTQFVGSQMVGSRTVNYTSRPTSATVVDIPTSYIPWVRPSQDPYVVVRVFATGGLCPVQVSFN